MYICLIMDGTKIEKARICEYTKECEQFYGDEGIDFFSYVVEESPENVFVFHKDKYDATISRA